MLSLPPGSNIGSPSYAREDFHRCIIQLVFIIIIFVIVVVFNHHHLRYHGYFHYNFDHCRNFRFMLAASLPSLRLEICFFNHSISNDDVSVLWWYIRNVNIFYLLFIVRFSKIGPKDQRINSRLLTWTMWPPMESSMLWMLCFDFAEYLFVQ